MTTNNRAADDAERESFEYAWARANRMTCTEWVNTFRAALSRADGGKGEAVALWAAFAPEGNLLAHSKLRPGLSDILNWEPLYRVAPQAECAPRKYDPATQPGDPAFDGAEAYQAHLAATYPAECALTDAQIDAAVDAWFAQADKDDCGFRSRMRAAILAANKETK
jgi:hypothetical protein